MKCRSLIPLASCQLASIFPVSTSPAVPGRRCCKSQSLFSSLSFLIAPSALRCTCQRDSESNSWVLTPVGAPVANSLGSQVFSPVWPHSHAQITRRHIPSRALRLGAPAAQLQGWPEARGGLDPQTRSSMSSVVSWEEKEKYKHPDLKGSPISVRSLLLSKLGLGQAPCC